MTTDEILAIATEKIGPEVADAIRTMMLLGALDHDGALALIESFEKE